MTHDNTGPVISKFGSIGATSIFNPDQVVFALDHDVQNKSAKNLEKYSKIESFAVSTGSISIRRGGGSGIRCWWRRGMLSADVGGGERLALEHVWWGGVWVRRL